MKRFIVLLFVLALIVAPITMSAQTGGDLFKAKCAACHGPNGEGKAALKTPDLKTDAVQKKTDAELKTFIATGAKHDFTKKGLTDEQIDSLVKFIRGLK
jgi:mono/diheme cytochrome c family protein